MRYIIYTRPSLIQVSITFIFLHINIEYDLYQASNSSQVAVARVRAQAVKYGRKTKLLLS